MPLPAALVRALDVAGADRDAPDRRARTAQDLELPAFGRAGDEAAAAFSDGRTRPPSQGEREVQRSYVSSRRGRRYGNQALPR
jgi:hypothetical protein